MRFDASKLVRRQNMFFFFLGCVCVCVCVFLLIHLVSIPQYKSFGHLTPKIKNPDQTYQVLFFFFCTGTCTYRHMKFHSCKNFHIKPLIWQQFTPHINLSPELEIKKVTDWQTDLKAWWGLKNYVRRIEGFGNWKKWKDFKTWKDLQIEDLKTWRIWL